MLLHMEGNRIIQRRREAVWSKLSSMDSLVQCIPDVAEVKEMAERSADIVVRPGFSFIRGELHLHLERVAEVAPESARIQARSKGIGSSSLVEAAIRLEPQEDATNLHWTADILELGGVLKAVPRGLLQGAAQKVISGLFDRLEQRLRETN